MTLILDGSPASEGIASGTVFHLEWGVPIVPHMTISEDQADAEIERFNDDPYPDLFFEKRL